MDYEAQFRRERNRNKAQRRAENRASQPEPEPRKPDPIEELAEICAELREALFAIIAQDVRRAEKILTPLSDRLNQLRWPE